MILFRWLLLATAGLVVALVAAYLLTGRRPLLRWAWRLLASMVALGLAFFAVLAILQLS